jgi:hypothetical protein
MNIPEDDKARFELFPIYIAEQSIIRTYSPPNFNISIGVIMSICVTAIPSKRN